MKQTPEQRGKARKCRACGAEPGQECFDKHPHKKGQHTKLMHPLRIYDPEVDG